MALSYPISLLSNSLKVLRQVPVRRSLFDIKRIVCHSVITSNHLATQAPILDTFSLFDYLL